MYFITYFTVPKVSVNYRNINTMKYNADIGALRLNKLIFNF